MGAREALPALHDLRTSAQICAVFDTLFLRTENTRLLGGGEEPVYLPADARCREHRIVFRHDYAASALHEVAHWCLAGPARRGLVDYGYWYAPDGRDAAMQCEFERVEVQPQALEWLFSAACGLPFRPSIDNLAGAPGDAGAFSRAIAAAAQAFCVHGLPARAARFREALAARWGSCAEPRCAEFGVDRLPEGPGG